MTQDLRTIVEKVITETTDRCAAQELRNALASIPSPEHPEGLAADVRMEAARRCTVLRRNRMPEDYPRDVENWTDLALVAFLLALSERQNAGGEQ